MITKEEYDKFCSILDNPGYLGKMTRGSRAYHELETMKTAIEEYEAAMGGNDGDFRILSEQVSKPIRLDEEEG